MKKYHLKETTKNILFIESFIILVIIGYKFYMDRIEAIESGKMTVQDQHEK